MSSPMQVPSEPGWLFDWFLPLSYSPLDFLLLSPNVTDTITQRYGSNRKPEALGLEFPEQRIQNNSHLLLDTDICFLIEPL